MKRQTTIAALIVVACFAAGAQTKVRRTDPHAQAKQEVLKVHQQIIEASLRNDYKTLDQLMSNNWIGTNSQGQTIMEKFTTLATIKAGTYKTHEHKEKAVQVRVDGDQVVVSGTSVTRGEQQGIPVNVEAKFEDVYEKKEGRWQAVLSRVLELEVLK